MSLLSFFNKKAVWAFAFEVIISVVKLTPEGKKLSGSEKKEDTDPDGFMHLPDGEELPFE